MAIPILSAIKDLYTKGIEESGSNSDGFYTKFADGNLMCHLVSSGATITVSNTEFMFPSNYVSSPAVFVSSVYSPVTEANKILSRDVLVRTSSNAWLVTHVDSTYESTITLFAIGRWK